MPSAGSVSVPSQTPELPAIQEDSLCLPCVVPPLKKLFWTLLPQCPDLLSGSVKTPCNLIISFSGARSFVEDTTNGWSYLWGR